MASEKDRDFLQSELEKTTQPDFAVKKPNTKSVGIGIRTYSADIASIMKKEKGSIIKIALAEQKRQKSYEDKQNPTSTKNLVVIFLGIIFIISGIMIFVFSILNKTKSVPISSPISVSGLFYFENQAQIDITNQTRGNFYNIIHENINADYASNETITNLFIINQISNNRIPANIHTFFNKLGIIIPEKTSNILTGNFMIGVHKIENTGNLFLVLKTKNFNETFTGMREWEVSMLNDLVRLFRISSDDFTGDIFNRNFQSGVLFNKQARNLFDTDGRLILTYVYIDDNTVLITKNNATVAEVIKRTTSQSIK